MAIKGTKDRSDELVPGADDNAVVLSPQANARYEKIIAEHEADRKAGKVKSFETVDELMKDLLS